MQMLHIYDDNCVYKINVHCKKYIKLPITHKQSKIGA